MPCPHIQQRFSLVARANLLPSLIFEPRPALAIRRRPVGLDRRPLDKPRPGYPRVSCGNRFIRSGSLRPFNARCRPSARKMPRRGKPRGRPRIPPAMPAVLVKPRRPRERARSPSIPRTPIVARHAHTDVFLFYHPIGPYRLRHLGAASALEHDVIAGTPGVYLERP